MHFVFHYDHLGVYTSHVCVETEYDKKCNNGICLLFANHKANWNDAREFCNRLNKSAVGGADKGLPEPHDLLFKQWLNKEMQARILWETWIGGYVENAKWTWVPSELYLVL